MTKKKTTKCSRSNTGIWGTSVARAKEWPREWLREELKEELREELRENLKKQYV